MIKRTQHTVMLKDKTPSEIDEPESLILMKRIFYRSALTPKIALELYKLIKTNQGEEGYRGGSWLHEAEIIGRKLNLNIKAFEIQHCLKTLRGIGLINKHGWRYKTSEVLILRLRRLTEIAEALMKQ